MADEKNEVDELISTMNKVLALNITPDRVDAIRMHLTIAARMAALIGTVPLPDDQEPAPVFTP